MEEQWAEPADLPAEEAGAGDIIDVASEKVHTGQRALVAKDRLGLFERWMAERMAQNQADIQIGKLLVEKPEVVERALESRRLILRTIESHGVQNTRPQDWVLRKGKGNEITAGMTGAGAQRIMQVAGIELFPHRDPQIRLEDDGSRTAWQTGIAYSAATNRFAINLLAERNSKEKFIGRGERAENESITDQDLKSAAASLLFRKAVEALTGLKNLRADDLRGYGINPDECTKGFGFSDDERDGSGGTGGTAGGGGATQKQREALWKMAAKAKIPLRKIERGGEQVGVADFSEAMMKAAGVKPPVVIRDLTKRQASVLIDGVKKILDAEAAES